MDQLTRYKKRLKIDVDDLDTELQRHSELLFHVGEQTVLAISRREELKEDIKCAEADFAASRRATGEKVTEAQIKREIEESVKFHELREGIIEATAVVGKWEALKEAFRSRGFLLRELSDREMTLRCLRQTVDEEDAKQRMAKNRRRITKGRERL